MLRCVAALVCAALLCLEPAAAQQVQAPAQFRDAVMAAIREHAPGAQVEARGDLALHVRTPSGEDRTMDVSRAYSEYTADPASHDQIIARWARVSSLSADDVQRTERIVSILRPRTMVEAQERAVAQGGESARLVYRPFAGDLVEVLAFDSADALLMASRGALAELGLSEAQAWALAPNNLVQRAGRLELHPVRGQDTIAYVTGGNGLAPSALTDSELCAEQHATLYLVVDRNGYFMNDPDAPGAATAFRAFVRPIIAAGESMSSTILTCRNGRLAEAPASE